LEESNSAAHKHSQSKLAVA